MKLSRKQIREGLKQVPIDTVLLGANSPIDSLTPKQREFARQVALGENKTAAYRKAYNGKGGKPASQSVAACRLAQDSRVSLMIEAYQLANEAAKYRTPAQLRELVIHQLTQHALNEECPPAQRIKALELLGKVSEVAAFTERKETTVINQSQEIRAKLLEHLKNVVDVEPRQPKDDADDLLQEIAQGGEDLAMASADPHPPGTPLSMSEPVSYSMHTTPHKQSALNSAEQSAPDSDPTPLNMEDPPLCVENESGGGVYFSENPASTDENLR